MLGFAYLDNTCLALISTKIWSKSLPWVWGTASFAASMVMSGKQYNLLVWNGYKRIVIWMWLVTFKHGVIIVIKSIYILGSTFLLIGLHIVL